METIKGLIKSLINGGIGAIVGAAFATAFGWNEWILAVIGYILGWLLLSKSFWEGVRESKEELAEEDRREEERKRKRESDDKERCSRVGVYHTLPVAFAVRNYVSSHCGRRNT
ncbi:MAG: hypothetical protein ACLVEU_15625 [Bacteroides cellulosilyticus]